MIGREQELERVIQILNRQAEEQPLPHRGTRRGENRHCRRTGYEDLPG